MNQKPDGRLLKRREKISKQLLDLAPKVLIGSISETYRTCGTPGCRCHSTGPKHGPHLYVSFLGDHGRTTGYYVRKAMEPVVREGISAWKTFQSLSRDLAHLNRELLQQQYATKTTAKTKKKKASKPRRKITTR